MYVCLCKGITDSDIEDAIENGAENFRALRSSLGISTDCGSCAPQARELLALKRQASAKSGLFYAAEAIASIATPTTPNLPSSGIAA